MEGLNIETQVRNVVCRKPFLEKLRVLLIEAGANSFSRAVSSSCTDASVSSLLKSFRRKVSIAGTLSACIRYKNYWQGILPVFFLFGDVNMKPDTPFAWGGVDGRTALVLRLTVVVFLSGYFFSVVCI